MLLDEESEAEIELLAARLDRLIPADGARLAFDTGPAGGSIVGNRLGYMRLAVELLKATLHPLPQTESSPARVAPDLGGVLADPSRSPFAECELDEAIVSRPPAASGLGALGQIGAGVAVVAALVLLLIGASVVWRWLFG
jgi:hypothetical protein